MKLSELIQELDEPVSNNYNDREITGINHNSLKIEKGFLFVAIKGHKLDGNRFVNDAIRRGAVAIVSEEELNVNSRIALIIVMNCRKTLSRLSSRFYGEPSKKIKVIGVTGTNGKTTTSYLIKSITDTFKQDENRGQHTKQNPSTGLIGTIEYLIGSNSINARETTPESIESQKFLSRMVELESNFAVMEVSSQALVQHRTDDIDFYAAVFTNLTPEHLDYHHSLENYRKAKSRLFTGLSDDAFAILNADDDASRYLIQNKKSKVVWYGIKNSADIKCKHYKFLPESTEMIVSYKGEELAITIPLIGIHNIYNALAAIASGIVLGIDFDTIKNGISLFKNVPGRLERVEQGQDFKIFVDYAHTANALEVVLESLNNTRHKGQRILLVFGCGGDRDREKRALMGDVASRLADKFWITSDNPRSEDPGKIITEIESGIKTNVTYFTQPDRKMAIKNAIAEARRDDMLLVAGKGHETTQIIGNNVFKFDDREIIKDLLRDLAIKN